MKLVDALTLRLGAVMVEMSDDGKVIVRDYDHETDEMTVYVMARVKNDWSIEETVLPIAGMHGSSIAVH